MFYYNKLKGDIKMITLKVHINKVQVPVALLFPVYNLHAIMLHLEALSRYILNEK